MKTKIIIISFILCLYGIISNAQTNHSISLDTTVKYYNNTSVTVIKPTIQNFLKLVNCTKVEFETVMKKYGYNLQDNPGKYVSYWNWNWGTEDSKALNTYCYNLVMNEIRCFVPFEYMYPSECMADLFASLKGKLHESKDGWDLFAFTSDGWVYQFIIGQSLEAEHWDIVFTKVQQAEDITYRGSKQVLPL